MYNALVSMLNFIIVNEEGDSEFANSISNHISNWVNKGWKKKIVDCYEKLTKNAIPQHLPIQLRAKYCSYIADEQLLSDWFFFLFVLLI